MDFGIATLISPGSEELFVELARNGVGVDRNQKPFILQPCINLETAAFNASLAAQNSMEPYKSSPSAIRQRIAAILK